MITADVFRGCDSIGSYLSNIWVLKFKRFFSSSKMKEILTRVNNLRRNQSNALPYTLSVVFVVFFMKLEKAYRKCLIYCLWSIMAAAEDAKS